MKKWQSNKKSGAGEKERQDRAGEKRCREISEPKKQTRHLRRGKQRRKKKDEKTEGVQAGGKQSGRKDRRRRNGDRSSGRRKTVRMRCHEKKKRR